MRELKWKPEQAAEVRILGNGAAAGAARILELSGKRMRLACELVLKPGAAVRLEWDGQLVLGEVVETAASGFWMEIHHMLLDTNGQTWQKQGWQA